MTRTVASARTVAGIRSVPAASLFFNQTGPVVSGSNNVLAGLTSFCVECFVNIPSIVGASNTARLMDFLLTGNDAFFAFSPGTSALILKVNAVQTGSAGNLSLNAWHHVAASYDNTNMYIFYDGVLKVTTANSGQTLGTGGSSFAIGNNGSGNARGAGAYIQDLRVSNVVRYTTGFTAPTAQLPVDASTILMYRFNEFRGTTASDSSTNSVTGTLSGSPLPLWSPGDPNITINYPGTPRATAGTRNLA